VVLRSPFCMFQFRSCSGYRAAYEPGGRRTGAPGKHVIRGKAKYRIIDEQVRYYVAPAIEDIRNFPVRRPLLRSSS